MNTKTTFSIVLLNTNHYVAHFNEEHSVVTTTPEKSRAMKFDSVRSARQFIEHYADCSYGLQSKQCDIVRVTNQHADLETMELDGATDFHLPIKTPSGRILDVIAKANNVFELSIRKEGDEVSDGGLIYEERFYAKDNLWELGRKEQLQNL